MILRNIRLIGLAGFVAAASSAASATAVAAEPSPVGVWRTIDDETGEAKSHVALYEREGKLYGKVVRLLQEPGAVCDACEGERKGEPIEGMIVVWGLERDDDEWEDGKIFDPEKGKTYDCRMWLESEDELKVRGYVGPFRRTQTWTRVR